MEYYFVQERNVDLHNGLLVIDDFEFKHLAKVLRKNAGDRIIVTDGRKNIYHCLIVEIKKTEILCKIENREFDLNEPGISVTVYLSLLRNISRYEFAIEKLVELGAVAIVPLITDFTIGKNKLSDSKIERIKKIMIGAMGQSQRCVLPELKDAVTFEEMIRNTGNEVNKIAMYEMSDDEKQIHLNKQSRNVIVLIGPEGGFSRNEVERLKLSGWISKSLGKRKLRAETAAVVSVFQIIKNHEKIKN